MTKVKTDQEKDYVVIYQSQEHYEVLGYIRAPSLEEAKKRARTQLLTEAQYYNVSEAKISEICQSDFITFDITEV